MDQWVTVYQSLTVLFLIDAYRFYLYNIPYSWDVKNNWWTGSTVTKFYGLQV